MTRRLALFAALLFLVSCSGAKQNNAPPPHAIVHLNDGSTVSGVVTASSQTEMVVAGDDGIERKIPMTQVKSVSYQPAPQQAAGSTGPGGPGGPGAGAPPAVATRTFEIPAGTDVAVRTGETIDSAAAAEGQTFDAVVAADVRDANGQVVVPAGSAGSVVITSASGGSRFKGRADLALTLQSLVVAGTPYAVQTTDFTQVGKQGVGANQRTAKFAGGGAAVGAIIGAIAGGGKGAAIGAGAGAGGGLLTQILTKGGSIKVPAGAVLTFRLEQPLRVTVQQ